MMKSFPCEGKVYIMNPEIARAMIKYIKIIAPDNDKVNKGLKDIKLFITQDDQNVHIFRKQGLTSLIANLFMKDDDDERVIMWLLSILTSCLLHKEFQEEVHNSTIIPAVVNVFKNTENASIRHRACRVIGQQCTYGLSVSQFHNLNALTGVLAFLKDAKEDEEKKTAIKTLRFMANNSHHCQHILKEDGLMYVCIYGLTNSNENLCLESIKNIYQMSKYPSTLFVSQVLKNTENLQLLSKFYDFNEDYHSEGKQENHFVLHTFLNIFWSHCSSSTTRQYRENCIILDYLTIADLPLMIICELQNKEHKININKEEYDLILALCKLSELDLQWKKFSFNVIPLYHERVWMDLADYNGLSMLCSLVSTHKTNLHLLPELLRGLLGLENCHNENKREIEIYLEANFLPVLLDIFDSALKEICNNPGVKSTWNCYHYPIKADDEKPKALSKEISKELLDFGGSQAHNSSTETKNTLIHNLSSPEGSTSTFTYKKMDKIKFRTGKKDKVEDENVVKTAKENSERFGCNSSTLLNNDSPDKFKNNKKKTLERKYELIGQHTEIWLTVLDYIIRLVYQIGGLYEERDVSCLCKHFLKKLYQYFYYSPIVHQSALKFLSSIARNTSSIQPIFDNLLIPKLTVDLVEGRLKDNCSQCSDIKRYVKVFLSYLQRYFNHYHHYGICEVNSRLLSLKPSGGKLSCITSFTHIVGCPKLFNTFLLEYKGLDYILSILSQPQQGNVYLYTIASLCTIFKSLRKEYDIMCNCPCVNKRYNRLFSEKNKGSDFSSCMVNMEKDKNCTIKLQHITINLNRDKLTSQNEVFAAMINGYFKESKENCICLDDVNPLAMEMVIHFIYGCKCDIFKCKDVDVFFELVHLTQMYFLPDLRVMAIHQLFELIDIDAVFDSLQKMTLFEEEYINQFLFSILNKSIKFSCHLQWIRKVLNSDLKKFFLDTIDKRIKSLLNKTSSLCNCKRYFLCL